MKGRVQPARLLIADDHPLVREGMQAMLAKEPDLEVISEAEDGWEALELCRELRPDLVLMDVRMPRMDGITATRAIKREFPRTVVLIVTSHENPDYLLEALRSGAAGYILKESSSQRVIGAIRRALNGESPLNQELAAQLLLRLADKAQKERFTGLASGRPLEKRPESPLPEPLTQREVAVLRLLARGQTNREIAQNLSVAVSTVKNHVQHLISKLEVSDRTQAAVRGIELSLVHEQEEEGHFF